MYACLTLFVIRIRCSVVVIIAVDGDDNASTKLQKAVGPFAVDFIRVFALPPGPIEASMSPFAGACMTLSHFSFPTTFCAVASW